MRRQLGAIATTSAVTATSLVLLATPADATTFWPPDPSYDCYYNAPALPGFTMWSFDIVGEWNDPAAYCRYLYISGGEFENGKGLFPAGLPITQTKAIDWDYSCRASYGDGATAWWFDADGRIYCNW